MSLRLSVVIPVYNNWWLTARTLTELERLREASMLSFETIVVDNASLDETPQSIARFGWARYLRLERNVNFAGACNAGARAAEAATVLFLNNDAYPLGDGLSPMVEAFDREDVVIAGGALFFEDGVTQCAGLVVLPNAHWHFSCRNLPRTLEGVTRSRDALGVSGAAMAVRKDWFLDNGGFDETYVNGFEDVDLCMRAREQRRAISYVATARFAHYEAATTGRFDREAENERLFYRRWARRFATIERTARGEVGAIRVHAGRMLSPLSAAGLEDLEEGLRSFGHPVVRERVRPWQRLDRRFRRSATLNWFIEHQEDPAVVIERSGVSLPTMHVRGRAEARVPWLPCAAVARGASVPVQRSAAGGCATVAVAGFEQARRERLNDLVSALDQVAARYPALQLIVLRANGDAGALARRFGDRARVVDAIAGPLPKTEVACTVIAGLTDESAFGNVALAHAELPIVAFASDEVRALLSPDVALIAESGAVADGVVRFIAEPAERLRYGSLVAADARRRFSPRRSAIRVVDLLCAARFGFERPAAARSNTPIGV
jgi:GT2 family glycosyltransferase